VTNIIQSPINGAQAPAAARARLQAGTALAGNFSEGVIDSFPMISFRGKVFRFRFQGEEKPHLDPQSGHPIPYLDVVLLNASPNISKAFYDTGFTEGANTPPTCWSIDGIRPDASVQAKQNPTCPDCRQNAFGSRVTPAGKQAKACQDRRRLVVGLAAGFGQREVLPIMLNAPQSSLKPMREYVMFLQRNGFPPNACVTRLSFDFNEAYPKLTFNFVQPLTDQQYAIAEQLENDDRTKRILQAAITGTAADDMDGEPGTLRTAATPPNHGYVQPAPAAPPPGPVAQAATAPPPPYQPPQPPIQPGPFDMPVTGTGYSSRCRRLRPRPRRSRPLRCRSRCHGRLLRCSRWLRRPRSRRFSRLRLRLRLRPRRQPRWVWARASSPRSQAARGLRRSPCQPCPAPAGRRLRRPSNRPPMVTCRTS
jgi:hypothetical protein